MWILNIQGNKEKLLAEESIRNKKCKKVWIQSQGEESKWLTQRHSTDHINQLEKVQRKDSTILITKVKEVQKKL